MYGGFPLRIIVFGGLYWVPVFRETTGKMSPRKGYSHSEFRAIVLGPAELHILQRWNKIARELHDFTKMESVRVLEVYHLSQKVQMPQRCPDNRGDRGI